MKDTGVQLFNKTLNLPIKKNDNTCRFHWIKSCKATSVYFIISFSNKFKTATFEQRVLV